MRPSIGGPRVTYWCGWWDCDMMGEPQKGDRESVEGVVLCEQCERPCYGTVGDKP